MRRLPPLNALPAFEATARLGSVGRAAEELGRTHGAVSKQIGNLEAALGIDLFEREGTGIRLTEHGAALMPDIARALDLIAEACTDLQRSSTEDVLVLGISATFASRWLMPRLPRFRNHHPDVQFAFRMAGRRPVDPPACDVIVSWDRLRFDRNHNDGYVAVGDSTYALVHAPGYPLRAEAGACHVDTRLLPDTLPTVWEAWAALSGITVRSEHVYSLPQTGLLIDAATNGMGAAILECRLIAEELDDERLVAPFGITTIPEGFGVFVSDRARMRPAVRDFVEWLRLEA